VTRHEQIKQPREYLAGGGGPQNRIVAVKELPFEFMLNALRLVEGFPTELFSSRTGLPSLFIKEGLKKAEEMGLLEGSLQQIRPTERGRRFLNDLTGLFLPQE
jgi:oxygen-independent coproporphyrinogen-3 oxidase